MGDHFCFVKDIDRHCLWSPSPGETYKGEDFHFRLEDHCGREGGKVVKARG